MEDAFKKLQNDKQNTVDNLVKWMKDSKIVEGKKVTEENARKMFAGVSDASNVEFAEFKNVIEKLANEQKMSVDEFSKTLAAQGQQFLNGLVATASSAVTAATSTFKEAMSGK